MRYAIYFTPPEGDHLAVLAADWLGRDHFQNKTVDQRVSEQFSQDELADLTAEPRRYGFHATLKAPFALADNADEVALHAAFDAFAETLAPVRLPSLALGQLGSFFALVPADWSEDLQDLADACVRHFEPFRAPLDEADISRRKPDSLSASQLNHLLTWGYPYVFEDFRFHMTLTGQVPADRQPDMRTLLAATFAPAIGRPIEISHLSLFKEPQRGAPFLLDRIKPLQDARQRKTA